MFCPITGMSDVLSDPALTTVKFVQAFFELRQKEPQRRDHHS